VPHIPEEIIDEIAARADLVEIALGYIPTLKQAGSRWKGVITEGQLRAASR